MKFALSISVIVLGLGAATAHAQAPEQSSRAKVEFASESKKAKPRFRIGIHGAGSLGRTLSASSVDGRNLTVEGQPQPGFGGGLGVAWFPAGWFSVESGAGWHRRAQTFAGVWSQSDYLEIPLVARIHPLDWFSFGAGAYYGYQFASSFGSDSGALLSPDEASRFNARSDLGLLVSARLDFRWDRTWGLYTEGRGMMSAASTDPLPGIRDRWEALQLLVGLAWYP